MTTKFKYYSDSGHGWLAVKRKLINQLGVTVSNFSYQKGQTVYLEEDADVSAFVDKFKGRYGKEPTIIDRSYSSKNYDKPSPIRSYDHYIERHDYELDGTKFSVEKFGLLNCELLIQNRRVVPFASIAEARAYAGKVIKGF